MLRCPSPQTAEATQFFASALFPLSALGRPAIYHRSGKLSKEEEKPWRRISKSDTVRVLAWYGKMIDGIVSIPWGIHSTIKNSISGMDKRKYTAVIWVTKLSPALLSLRTSKK
ncbi:Hypothetical protein NTJ_07512 [Nesidiocoris tenuis]|uniref:Uncharacterized protein n=1 Tax=Nesidiocoris tenuis TaxID=355587 RepID=A0ABN7ARY9_9HEMI|nr:Hypothetical protein NTJ_07512 [Nesidiocoris tenuis]